jgi:acyl dehydratase
MSMKFNDFLNKRGFTAGPYVVTETEILSFAEKYDPQWFHTDVHAAEQGRWEGLIASGWHTCAIAMRLACDGALAGSTACGSPGLDYLKWLHPVRPGDALVLNAEVLDARTSATNTSLGIVKWKWRLANQLQVPVLDTVVTSFFDLA